MTRERDDEPRKAVHPTSQPGPTPDDVNDDPTEAERLLRALHGITWYGEPVSAAVERVIAQARREGAAEAWDEGAEAVRQYDYHQPPVQNPYRAALRGDTPPRT